MVTSLVWFSGNTRIRKWMTVFSQIPLLRKCSTLCPLLCLNDNDCDKTVVFRLSVLMIMFCAVAMIFCLFFFIFTVKVLLPLWQEEVMFLVVLVVCLPVCLFVCLWAICEQHYSKKLWMDCNGIWWRVQGGTVKNWLSFGGNLGLLRWANEQKKISSGFSLSWLRCR